MGSLSGYTVVEVTRDIPAAWAGRQFADHGARVTALEPVGGHPLRQEEPLVDGESLLWRYVSEGKSLVTSAEDENLADLIQTADMLILDGTPEELAELGISIDQLQADRPGLTILVLSPFGSDGPLANAPATDFTVEAMSGYLSQNGRPDQPPLRSPAHILAFAVGVSAFIGAVAALHHASASKRGQLIEVAGLEAIASFLPFIRAQYGNAPLTRTGGAWTGCRLCRCKTGWVTVQAPTAMAMPGFQAVLGFAEDDIPEDCRDWDGFSDPTSIFKFLERYTINHDAKALAQMFLDQGMIVAEVSSHVDVLNHAQLEDRQFFGPTHSPGRSALVSASSLGEPSNQRSLPSDAPLKGIRILDLTQAWIGPYASLLLADLGADVIKVENHRRPDVWRGWPNDPRTPQNALAHPANTNPNFNSVNRSKRSLTLDLKSEKGRLSFLGLVTNSDVVMENFSARVMGNFGLGYDALAKVRPGLVMLSSSGFGKSGPMSPYKSNGTAIQALAGWDALHAYGPDDAPVAMGFYQADAICGLQVAAYTLVAIMDQQRSGRGCHIDAAMLDTAAGYIGDYLLAASLGVPHKAIGNRHPRMAPHGVFPARGNDNWISIAVRDDRDWMALCSLAEAGTLDDQRLATTEGRLETIELLEGLVAGWTRDHDAAPLANALMRVGVPAAPVGNILEVLDDKQLRARNWFQRVTHPDMGEYLYPGTPWRFSECRLPAPTPAPKLGEHSREILRDELGYNIARLMEMMAEEVTGSIG